MALPPAELLRIHELYARYNHAIDSGDVAAYTACFAPDGRLVRRDTVLSGPSELGAFARDVAARALRHMTTDIVIDGVVTDGGRAGNATGRAYVMVLGRQGEDVHTMTAGSYSDELRLEAGSWVFVNRHYVTMP